MSKILIVEDDTSLNQAYQTILQREGYEVRCVSNGEEALAVADSFQPDLVLLDLLMPKVSGIEFLRQYDLLGKHPNVQVIVFSNLDMQPEIDEAYKLGAKKYILKAWATPQQLVSVVKDLLKKP
jgi:CheY-like chemotaxis protein